MSDQKGRLQSCVENKNTTHSRADAVRILTIILRNKKSLATATESINPKSVDPFAQALCYGVLRFYYKLNFFLTELTTYPIKDLEIKTLILVGLYQLFYLNKPAYAAVTETVNAARQLKKTWATKLVNGILRNALRVREALEQKASQDPVYAFSHPQWLIALLQKDYPNQWQAILDHNNQHAPLTLRLNTQQYSREFYLDKLQTQNILAEKTCISPYGVHLENPLSVNEIYGFKEGFVSIQDEAGQLVVPLLKLADGQVVLDACAAPGGKTTHMLEVAPNLDLLIAADADEQRLKRVEENLQRITQSQTNIKTTVKLICSDIKLLASHIADGYFDRILLDVPCSATGVIRRHPDIKLLRLKSDIAKITAEQYQILISVWRLLKIEGILLYSTCSILKTENSDVVERFLRETTNAIELPLEVSWGESMPVGKQILPGQSNMDGFYFCRIKKIKL